MDWVAALTPVTQVAVTLLVAGLAIVAIVRASRTGVAGWWAAATFAALGVALVVMWTPRWLGFRVPAWTGHLAMATLLAFPYLLLRFTATFRALPRLLEIAAAALAATAMLLMLLFAVGVAAEGVVLLVALSYWISVSAVTVVRLWRAGRGQPGVARRRLRLMSVAAAVLAIALIVAEAGDAAVVALVTHGLVLASVLAFGLGFAPPRALRLSWRRREDAQVQAATTALLQLGTVEEVHRHLLPPTAAIIGASGVMVVDDDGRVVAREGEAPALGERLGEPDEVSRARRRVVAVAPLGQGHGQLVAWTSAYTPFFGPEERGLFHSLAAIGGLALDRCVLLAEERTRRIATEQARQEADAARAEAERARQEADGANLAKNEFLSRMSHELRTPLNAVLGFGQLLEVSDLADEDHEAVAHILKAGRHLLALIDDVLDLSRIEAGTLTISLEPVHAADLVRDSIALVEPLAADRSIRLSTDAADCDHYVVTDRQRCRQVLLNLLSNAVKYNRDHGAVQVSCQRSDDATLRIAVRDTGPGIDPSRQSRLFQPFERLGAETSTVQGTGLGLALTRQLVERLGGAIDVDSTPGEGSTFWIDLPLTDPPATPERPTIQRDVSMVDTGSERQILLVEDNLENLRLVEAVLRRRPDLSLLPAMQGALALELAYQHRPALVVLDVHLPDMSGRDVLVRLKADPRTRHIPVIVASADATPGRIRQLHEDGAVDYLTKPLDLTRFLEAIDAALGSAPRPPG